MNLSLNSGNGSVRLDGGDKRPVLITGGCGFIGTNLAHRYLSNGQRVILFDNLSRPGAEKNLKWLRETHGNAFDVEINDVRNPRALRGVIRNVSKVFHFAAQVAVTTSLSNPIEDFEVNARGTLNVLEAIRDLNIRPSLVFTSSNKVYGDLAEVRLNGRGDRYTPVDRLVCQHGFSENQPLHFHSPYGCSKGAGGQYVLDYARTFGVPAAVFHMSCIYGPHQFGNEDQGWVAHFLIRAMEGHPITIYGNGKQVRDILFVEDLVDALLLAQKNISRLSGQSFNIGGGTQNTVSLLELLQNMERLCGRLPDLKFEPTRAADQLYYVSDIRKFFGATGWWPKVAAMEGIQRLYAWLAENHTSPTLRRFNAVSSSDTIRRNPVTYQPSQSQPRSKRLWRRPEKSTEVH